MLKLNLFISVFASIKRRRSPVLNPMVLGTITPFKPFAAIGEFSRDDGGLGVSGFSHAGGDQVDNPFPVGGFQLIF